MEKNLSLFQRLSIPFRTENSKITEILRQGEIDPDKIFIMSPESVIKEIFSDHPELITYYSELIESLEKSLTAFEKVWSKFFVEKESESDEEFQKRGTEYMSYVYCQMTSQLYSLESRKVVVLFLAALEYKQSKSPGFYVSLVRRDSININYFDDHVEFSFEIKNGRRFENILKEGYLFTLPGLLSEDFQINGLRKVCGLAINDEWFEFILHELGHTIFDLLGFDFVQIPLALCAQNSLMKSLFFPFLNKAQKIEEILIAKILQKSQSSKCANDREHFENNINDAENYFRKNIPPTVAEKEIEELEKIKNMFDEQFDDAGVLIDKSLENSFLKAFAKAGIKFMGIYDPWTTLEEVRQIIGIISHNGYIYVVNFCDFDFSVKNSNLIRWSHICVKPDELNPNNLVNLCPEENFVKLMFALHGFDFDEYVRQLRIKESYRKQDATQKNP